MDWEGRGKKRATLTLKCYTSIYLQGLRVTTTQQQACVSRIEAGTCGISIIRTVRATATTVQFQRLDRNVIAGYGRQPVTALNL